MLRENSYNLGGNLEKRNRSSKICCGNTAVTQYLYKQQAHGRNEQYMQLRNEIIHTLLEIYTGIWEKSCMRSAIKKLRQIFKWLFRV